MRAWFLLLLVSGCDEAAINGHASPPDLAAPSEPDLAMIVDAAVSVDQAAPPDLAPLSCDGGYLNSDAANACPLGCGNVAAVTDEGRLHIPFCTAQHYVSNPPASGPHWPAPAFWGIYGWVLPEEWWVHNLEHGGIVLLYNCPTDAGVGAVPLCTDGGSPPITPSDKGCPNEILQMQQLYASHPPDNWYDLFTEVKIVVTSDPLMPRRFAAVAWDWLWESDTFDVQQVQCFIDARYGRGPENAP
jgi:hypothetical protein